MKSSKIALRFEYRRDKSGQICYMKPVALFVLSFSLTPYSRKAAAYWLIDEIAFQQTHPLVKNEEFQAWILNVDVEQSTAILTCDNGNDQIVFTKQIGFTDFPLEEIKSMLKIR